MEITDKIFNEICARIAEGESLRSICSASDMPSQSRVYARLAMNKEWQDIYTRAREQQADVLADEVLDVARNASNQTWASDRLQIDALKWRAAKLKPKVYGDRQDINLSGSVDVAQTIVAARNRSGG